MLGLPFLSQEEGQAHLHFLECIDSLNRAWLALKEIENNETHSLSAPAYGYALVQYAHPYSDSLTKDARKLRLRTKYIPKKHMALHLALMNDRNKIFAHTDLSVSDGRITGIHKVHGMTFLTMTKNADTRFWRMEQIPQILKLIEGTLDNMYADRQERQEKLYIRKLAAEKGGDE